jgi:hypothetical protein
MLLHSAPTPLIRGETVILLGIVTLVELVGTLPLAQLLQLNQSVFIVPVQVPGVPERIVTIAVPVKSVAIEEQVLLVKLLSSM